MTNSPNQTPNPNRRRRLTADELIAIVVALAGIGSVFFWGLGQQNRATDSLSRGIATGSKDEVAQVEGGTATNQGAITRERQQSNTTIVEQPQPTINPIITMPVLVVPAVPARTVTVPRSTAVVPIPVAPTVAKPAFTDVPQQFWAGNYIEELRKRGVLDDFGSGKFDPSLPITRGEYAKMIDRAFADRPQIVTSSGFKDIPDNYPRKEAIDKSVRIGFLSGYSPTKFAPEQKIPRYQLLISLAKGLALPIRPDSDRILKKYSDAGQLPKYAKEKTAAALESGLIIKDDRPTLLKPNSDATRADAAALVYAAMVKDGKIQPQQQSQPTP